MLVSKHPEKLENTPAAAFVLTNKALRRSGVKALPDALRLGPGWDKIIQEEREETPAVVAVLSNPPRPHEMRAAIDEVLGRYSRVSSARA